MMLRALLRRLRDHLAYARSRSFRGPEHLRLGKLGEDLAVNALRAEGFRIAGRNVKVYNREIDVVAVEGDTLVFAEVKTRSGHSFGAPLEAVDKKRRDRLRKAAELYALEKKLGRVPIRFDVVTVDFAQNPSGRIEIIRNAF